MKTILTILLLSLLYTCNAQYSKMPTPYNWDSNYNEPLRKLPEIYVPTITLASTFATNEFIIRSDEFRNMSSVQKRNITASVYFTGAIITIGSHYLIKAIKKKRN